MAKLTKEELKSKIDEKIEDSDLKLELLEDIVKEKNISIESDDIERVDKAELDELKAKYDELYDKYKSRFLEVKEAKEVIEDIKEDIDSDNEVKEEEIIDVQEI